MIIVGDSMKINRILIVLLIILLTPIVKAEVCNTDQITISSIVLESKSDNVEEKAAPTTDGQDISLNLGVSSVGDNATYKIVVTNDSTDDFEFDPSTLDTDYISYTVVSNDDNIIPAGTSKEILLKVEYKNQVPLEAFEGETLNDNKTVLVNLSQKESEEVKGVEENPQTGIKEYVVLISLLILSLVIVFLLIKHKDYFRIAVLLLALMATTMAFIPNNVKAVCKYTLSVNANISIKRPAIFYLDEQMYLFNEGMTWEDYLNSSYNVGKWTTQEYYRYSESSEVPHGPIVETDYNYIDSQKSNGIFTGKSSRILCTPYYYITWFSMIETNDNFAIISDSIINGYHYRTSDPVTC
jgi:hypothetical protein